MTSYAMSRRAAERRRMMRDRDVTPVDFDAHGVDPAHAAKAAIQHWYNMKRLAEGDRVILTHGDHTGQHGGTNTLKLLLVGPGGMRGGGVKGLLGMVPGIDTKTRNQIREANIDERHFDRLEAIIRSMTPHERQNPKLINGSRRRRIAPGSGTNVQTVNQFLAQFKQMQKTMKQLGRGKMPQIPGMQRR